MAALDFGSDGHDAESTYHFRSPSRRRHQRRHVHFDRYKDNSEDHQELEVSCDRNPTQLFILLSERLWHDAFTHLQKKPIEAHIWISSRSPDSDEYKWCNLPLHLACLYGQEHPPLQFVLQLIDTYPGACQCRNHEGNLPIHLACECMDLSPRFGLEVEGIIGCLIEAFPESLSMMDSQGRKPIDILQERGVGALNREQVVGRGVAIMKFMRTQARVMAEHHCERDECTNKGDKKAKRHSRNVEIPYATTGGTVLHEEGRPIKTVRDFNFNNIEVPHLMSPISATRNASRDDSAAHRREDLEARNRLTSTSDTRQQKTPNTENFLIEDKDKSPHDNQPHKLFSLFSPVNIATQEKNITEHFDPFHQLETELTSMKTAHQSMSNLLSDKTQKLNQLLEQLQRLDTEHTQLQKDHAQLNSEHSEITTELEVRTKALENATAMSRVMKSKEKALSSELACTLGVQEKRDSELDQLKRELEREQEARVAASGELEYQRTMNAGLKNDNENLRSGNKTLKKENEDLKESIDRANSENAKLEKQNKSLKEQVLRWSTALTSKDNSELEKDSKKLNTELAQTQADAEKTRAQNGALCAVALKAIEAVSRLQHKVKHIPVSGDTSDEDLKLLLYEANTAPNKASNSRKSCSLNVKESLELMHPIISDAQTHQGNTIEAIQKILQQSRDIMHLIGQIPSIPHKEFKFESALHILEESITSSFNVLETLNVMLESNEKRKSKLMYVCRQTSGEVNNNILMPPTDLGAPGTATITEIMDAVKINSIASRHVEKLESLSKTVAGLPQMKKMNLDSDKEDVQKHLRIVDEITSGLQRNLSKMVHDAKEIKLIHQNIH